MKKYILTLILILAIPVAASAQTVFTNMTGTYTATVAVNPGLTCHSVQMTFLNYSGVGRVDASLDGTNFVEFNNFSGVVVNGAKMYSFPAGSAPTHIRYRLVPHYLGGNKDGTVSGHFNAN